MDEAVYHLVGRTFLFPAMRLRRGWKALAICTPTSAQGGFTQGRLIENMVGVLRRSWSKDGLNLL